MMVKYLSLMACVAILTFSLVGCETANQGMGVGALSGGALGAGAGALLGGRHHSGTGAIVGGVAGALGGGAVGRQLGAQKQTSRRQDAAIDQALTDANTQIINVQTSTGGTVPVRLQRQGTVWVGPRGETYPNLPSPRQLEPVYGF